jgi:2'-5' RNA ligase
MQDRLRDSPSFPVELQDVRQFLASGVIYIALGAGYADLEHLHGQLNSGGCHCSETWTYHPHLTLAQGLPASAMAPMLDRATRRWREFQGFRSFALDRVTFVQNVADEDAKDKWADLESFDLRPTVAV